MNITKLLLSLKIPTRICAVALACALAACSAGPPPPQISEARIALQEARRARADELAVREYDAAVRHLSVAESTWNERQDAKTAAHWARRAEAAAREAQYLAEARTAEDEIRREGERRGRAEIAIRDAEIARLNSQARTDAEIRAAEAEQQVREERRRARVEQERREAAAEQTRIEAEARLDAEERARAAERREAEAREAEQERREDDSRAAEEDRLRLEEQRRQLEEQRREEEEARAAEITRLREEQERTREEMRATLSRLGEVRQEARGLVLTLPGSVYFEVNKSVVQPAMRSRLTEIARALSRAGDDASILIEGHTDADGSNEYNLELSRLRAEAVRSVLVGGGVSPDSVETQGYGETRPIASNSSSSGKAQNRRVEIVLQGSAAAAGR
jgi:outer membrane protein OmpA-like peptidoglycan-associated protein